VEYYAYAAYTGLICYYAEFRPNAHLSSSASHPRIFMPLGLDVPVPAYGLSEARLTTRVSQILSASKNASR
jgi:hypothetical protein